MAISEAKQEAGPMVLWKRAILGAVRAVGLELVRREGKLTIVRRQNVNARPDYAKVEPLATYSPWRTDSQFLHVFDQIRDNTLVDVFRCYELWEAVGQVRCLPGNLLEVGVWKGGSGALIAARAKLLGFRDKTVYLCDTFSGVVKTSERDSFYVGGEHADTSQDDVSALVKSMQLDNVTIKQGIFPEDFPADMRTQVFCFVHIDVDVYQSAKDVFNCVWPAMPLGGVVVFDDYGFDACDGIPKLISELRGTADKIIIHNLNGHAVVVKLACA